LISHKYLKMSIIGIMPVLIAIDGFKSSLFYAALLFLSITSTAVFLFSLKNLEFRLKFPAAVIFAMPFNYFAYLFFKLSNYQTGWKPEFFTYICAFSIGGLYLGNLFKNLTVFEAFKFYCLVISTTITLLLLFGGAISLTGPDSNFFVKNNLFSYPGIIFIFLGITGILLKKFIEKLI